ncbi:MAG: hypothetical protein IJ019_04155 [Alphaproteobacteria bacterium]|nr:hypothetical protein [Alphaproteobacteria bacterium]
MLLMLALVFFQVAKADGYKDKTAEDLKIDLSIFMGYNFTGSKPVASINLGLEAFCIRADIIIGLTSINHPLYKEAFTTFNPSIGIFYGDKHKIYLMGGFQNYAYIATTDVTNCKTDVFCTDGLFGKIKTGYQLLIFKKIFITAEFSHLFTPKNNDVIYFPSTSISVGLGYRF